jgi:hypothetical protein
MDDKAIERLESYAIYDKVAGGEALLRLAIHHLRNPTADPGGATWVANRLVEALDTFSTGAAPAEKAFRLNRGDIRTAAARAGNDPALGVPWAVSIVFHVDVLRDRGFKTAAGKGPGAKECVFSAVANDLNERAPRGLQWEAKDVKTAYYSNRKSVAAEVAELRHRLILSQK